MATTTISTPTLTPRKPKLTRAFIGSITVAAPRTLSGPDSICTLLPNAVELAAYLSDPQLAVEAYCFRTGASMMAGVLAFRALISMGGIA
jgi:hypothetical protein